MSADFRVKIGRDSVRTFVSGAVASALAILTGIVLAKALGPSGKGEYSAVRLLYDGVVAIAGGAGSAIVYYLTKGDKPLRALLPPLLRAFFVLCAVLWLGSLGWAALHGFNLGLVVFMIIVPASIIISWQPSLFVSFDRVKSLNYQNVTLALITFLGTAIALLLFHTSVVGPLAAWMFGLYVLALVVVLFSIETIKREPAHVEPVSDREIVNFSVRSSLTNVLAFLNSRIDSMLVIALIGIAGFGIYSMATGISELLYALSGSIATATARSIGVSNLQTSATVTAKAVRFNLIVVTLVSCVIFIFAPFLINKIYGKAFDSAALPLRILLPGLVMFSSARIFNAFFTYQLGRPIFAVYLLVVVTLLQAIGCLVFIPMLGLAGAAWASTGAYVIATLGQSWYFCRVSKISHRALWLPTMDDLSKLYEVAALTAKASFSTR